MILITEYEIPLTGERFEVNIELKDRVELEIYRNHLKRKHRVKEIWLKFKTK